MLLSLSLFAFLFLHLLLLLWKELVFSVESQRRQSRFTHSNQTLTLVEFPHILTSIFFLSSQPCVPQCSFTLFLDLYTFQSNMTKVTEFFLIAIKFVDYVYTHKHLPSPPPPLFFLIYLFILGGCDFDRVFSASITCTAGDSCHAGSSLLSCPLCNFTRARDIFYPVLLFFLSL